jgi:hypothetical protein
MANQQKAKVSLKNFGIEVETWETLALDLQSYTPGEVERRWLL